MVAPSLNVPLAASSTNSTTPVYLDRCQRALVDEETFALCKYITNNNKGVAEPLHMGCGEISFDVEPFLRRVSLFSLSSLFIPPYRLFFPPSAPSFHTCNSPPPPPTLHVQSTSSPFPRLNSFNFRPLKPKIHRKHLWRRSCAFAVDRSH